MKFKCLLLVCSIFLFIQCTSTDESPKLSPQAQKVVDLLASNTPEIPEKIATSDIISERRNMLGELLNGNDLGSDTIIIVEKFGVEPAPVYQYTIYNSKGNAATSYKSDHKRMNGSRNKNIIQGEYEMAQVEVPDEDIELLESVYAKGMSAVEGTNSSMAMFGSMKSNASIVTILIKDGDTYKVESKKK